VYDSRQWSVLKEAKTYSIADSFFFVGNGSFTLHLVRKPPSAVAGGSVVATEASSGRAGVRLTSQLLQLDKVDHLICTFLIEEAPAMEDGERSKVARSIAALLNIVSSRVIVENDASAHDQRRMEKDSGGARGGSDHGETGLGSSARTSASDPNHRLVKASPEEPRTPPEEVGRKIRAREEALWSKTRVDATGAASQASRAASVGPSEGLDARPTSAGARAWRLRASQDLTVRIWCGSPTDVDFLGQQMQSLLKAGALTVSMQLAGLMGTASLKRLSLFRCGAELTCQDKPPETRAPIQPVVETTPEPPTPFPLLEVLLLSGTIVVPAVLVSVGVCLCVFAMYFRRKAQERVLKSQVRRERAQERGRERGRGGAGVWKRERG
jgi:hypothetical protein